MTSPNTEELIDPEICSDAIAGLDVEPAKPVTGRFSGKFARWITKGGLAILDQGLISGSNFLIGILLARWLMPEQYGAFALAFYVFLLLSARLSENAAWYSPDSHLLWRSATRRIRGSRLVDGEGNRPGRRACRSR